MKRFAFFIGFFLLFSGFVFSQTKIAYSGDSGYTLVERTNLRRYVNGKYSGLTSREVRSFISRSFAPEGVRSLRSDRWYDGNFFVIEETLRNSKATMAGIHEAIPSVFKISADGKMTMFQDNGYPTFRSFPSYSTEQLKPGDSWKGEGERAVDPMNKGIFTRMPILVLYTFVGEENYRGEQVYRIKAIWQTNYGFSNFNFDPKGDSTLKKATGGHKADIIVRASTGEAILINDNVDETFAYSDGSQVNLKGTITLFTEYPPAIDHDKLIFALNRIAKADTGATSKAVKADRKAGGSSGAGEKVASAKGNGTDERDSLAWGGNSQKGGNSTETDTASVSGAGTGFGSISSKKEKSGSSGSKNVKSRLDEKFASAKGGAGSQGSGSDGNGRGIDGSVSDSSSSGTDKNNMVYEETPAGIRLSVRDIKFKPDSDQVLPGEKSRLDEIAEVLKLAPNSQFLIEGHTASVGKPAGEQKLSEERAKNIATELAKRGIPADRFICKGHGGNKPIASNSTDSGRAQNRRVEITILE
ncbi:OmpA family protein [Treponema ruminis]|uniref:Outer membrane protein OmpA-like peptidoglycan-associated protein n=1 Tax=Treponema ruminis TaxID=744515 RepID=A0A7W8G6T6_9SPIR|nr:OmpA family protein [Treponema ruminis]MBB5224933.1 outer membrane protein OmpA-like peptidoglycan-associated protein [Treponema ruminis]